MLLSVCPFHDHKCDLWTLSLGYDRCYNPSTAVQKAFESNWCVLGAAFFGKGVNWNPWVWFYGSGYVEILFYTFMVNLCLSHDNCQIENPASSYSVVWHWEAKNERAPWGKSPHGGYWSTLFCGAAPVEPDALVFLPAVNFSISRKLLYIFLAQAFKLFVKEWNKNLTAISIRNWVSHKQAVRNKYCG